MAKKQPSKQDKERGWWSVKIEIKPLTIQISKWMQGLDTYRGDRSLATAAGLARLGYLNNCCDTGAFYTPDWSVAAVNGKVYRVNGGTSSRMLCNRAESRNFPKGLQVLVRTWHADSLLALADLYHHFDTKTSLRTPDQKMAAHLAAEPELSHITSRIALRIASGMSLFIDQFGKTEEDRRIQTVHAYQPYFVWAAPFSSKVFLARKHIGAAMYGTWKRSRSQATEFWNLVIDASHPKVMHPTRQLHSIIRDNKNTRPDLRIHDMMLYANCVQAWNFFRAGCCKRVRATRKSITDPPVIK